MTNDKGQMTNEQKFRVCPNCGNLTPAQRADCEYCGFSSVEILAAQQEETKERRFFEALFTRKNPFTLLFIGINAGVFILEWLAGGMGSIAVNPAVLVELGAKVNPLIDQQHQYWRFITSMFLHIGFLHFLLNNYALYIIGLEIERIYGSARFVILYFVTGVVGSLASYLFTDATSAGASGAIFGLFGVMATFAFRYRKEIPGWLSKDIKRRVIPIIAINLAFGFSVRIVDNAAHLGGLLAGVLLALFIPYKRPQERTSVVWRAGQCLLLAAAFTSFVFVFANYNGPKLSFANLTTRPSGEEGGEEARRYYDQMKIATDSLRESVNLMADIVNDQNESGNTAPAAEAVERGIRALNAIPPIDEQAGEFKQQALDLLNEQKDIVRRFNESNPKSWDRTIRDENALGEKYIKFRDDFTPWLVEFMRKHGYVLERTGAPPAG